MQQTPSYVSINIGEEETGRNCFAFRTGNPYKDDRTTEMMLSSGASQTFRRLAFLTLTLFLFLFRDLPKAEGALQFDVFAGFDSYVREGDWYPITFEVNNDGPSFRAYIEISSAQFNRSQGRRIQVDLPTGTLKRISIPVFAASRHGLMEARLIDEKGNVLVKQELDWQKLRYRGGQTVILGALARTSSGVPTFPTIKVNNPELQPAVARWQPAIFPDNPISLQGMQALYLSSERALDLKDAQIKALLAWLQGGGHLIVGVEQIGDVNGTAWLREILPAKLTETKQVAAGGAFLDWLREKGPVPDKDENSETAGSSSKKKKTSERQNQSAGALFKAAGTNLVADPEFEGSELQVAVAQVRTGRVIASAGGVPLAIESSYGRGEITLLTFSPERLPFTAWKNKDWLWALIAKVPVRFYESTDFNQWGFSSDSVLGAMIESTQVRKVPLMGLVGLLIVYLVIIGPVDQLVLRRMNKQMLTWVTFPCYVLLFSGLIYFIGFKLRAGESEYSELHIVDVLPNQDKAILRGKTYASVYSPANVRYKMKSEQFIASLRGEFLANWGNGEENSQAQVTHIGNRFDAEVYVPVWTSQLYVNDWWQPVSANPLVLIEKGPSLFTVSNNLDRALKNIRICVDGIVHELGEIPASSSKDFDVEKLNGVPFREFARKESSRFLQAAEMRRQSFGSESSRINWDLPNSASAACFLTQMSEDENYRRFASYDGLDLSKFATQDSVILLAWDGGNSLTKPLNQFKAARGAQNTLLRVIMPRQLQPQLSRAN